MTKFNIMTYSDIEKKFGKGEKIDFPYEMEHFTYQFANSKKVLDYEALRKK